MSSGALNSTPTPSGVRLCWRPPIVFTRADPNNHHVGRGQTSYFGSGARSSGAKPEVQRAESGSWVLGEGQGSQPPSHQLGGLEELRKFPQRGTGQKRGRKKVSLHSRGASWPLLELDGGQVRGRQWPPCPLSPLNPPTSLLVSDRCRAESTRPMRHGVQWAH